jgi:hypothetical protein
MSTQTDPAANFKPPAGMNLDQWMRSRVATRATRSYDWNALKFQADFDPKYRRAQMRYVGTGATGVAVDANTVQAEHFTFSTMILPAGAEGPLASAHRRRRSLLRSARTCQTDRRAEWRDLGDGSWRPGPDFLAGRRVPRRGQHRGRRGTDVCDRRHAPSPPTRPIRRATRCPRSSAEPGIASHQGRSMSVSGIDAITFGASDLPPAASSLTTGACPWSPRLRRNWCSNP